MGAPIQCARFRGDLGPVSRWVARRGLDLLPFLLNVLRGEMALVGPRPDREELVLRWNGVVPDYERRFAVLPGLTGLAQLSGCAEGDFEGVRRRLQFDLHYIEHRSLLLDLRTLARTVGVVLRGVRGPVERTAGDLSGPAMAGSPPAVKGVTR